MKIKLDNGLEADVIHVVREDGSVVLTATAGESSHSHTLTLGSVDQPLPDHYTDEHLQKDLADARKYAASMAVSKMRKLALLKNI
jgi:coenzyme F420-reducing hydrogenase alpha subunit